MKIVVQAKITSNLADVMNSWVFESNQEVTDYVCQLQKLRHIGKISKFEVWVQHKDSGRMIPYEQWLKKCGEANTEFARKIGVPKTVSYTNTRKYW